MITSESKSVYYTFHALHSVLILVTLCIYTYMHGIVLTQKYRYAGIIAILLLEMGIWQGTILGYFKLNPMAF